jgi:hypothetical protein
MNIFKDHPNCSPYSSISMNIFQHHPNCSPKSSRDFAASRQVLEAMNAGEMSFPGRVRGVDRVAKLWENQGKRVSYLGRVMGENGMANEVWSQKLSQDKFKLVGGLEPWNFMTFHSVANVIIPSDELIYFSEG